VREIAIALSVPRVERPANAGEVYRSHANFVWVTLQRMGVRESDREDVFQDVFIVVHQRLHTYDPAVKLGAWLFGICLRVVSNYRRNAWRRVETGQDGTLEARAQPPETAHNPDDNLAEREARARLQAILDEMDVEKRAVIVMFEIEELACDEIASILGVPVGTVYSRIHAAHAQFEKVLARYRARDARGGVR
jgi:RNA polymerase sigma-70 factor (ECF subfamily)